MPVYGTFTHTDVLSMAVHRHVSKYVESTALYSAAGIEALARNPEKVHGSRLEWVMRSGNPNNSVAFNAYGTNDGQTALEPDSHIYCQSSHKYVGTIYKLSDIKLSEAGGGEDKIGYAKRLSEVAIDDVIQKCNQLLYNGDPSTNGEEPFGLDDTIDYVGTQTYAGQTRSVSRALVGNSLNAANITINTGDITSCTITPGSTAVTLGTSSTWEAGDIVTITDANGIVRRYRASTSVTGTALVISPQLDYDQAATSSATVSIQAPFYAPNTGMGAANEFDLAKVNRGLAMATDGTDVPTIGLCDSFLYEGFINETLATEQSYTVEQKNTMGPQTHVGFKYRTLTVNVDNNIAAGNLYLLNPKYLMFKSNPKFASIGLKDGRLKEEASVSPNSFANLLGTIIKSSELCCSAINRQTRITGMTS